MDDNDFSMDLLPCPVASGWVQLIDREEGEARVLISLTPYLQDC